MKWWNDLNVEVMYAVGVPYVGVAADGQEDGWMLEGLFKTEEEAVEHCLDKNHFVVSVPVGMMTGREIPDGMYWPLLQTKEEGQARIELYRQGLPLE